MSSKPNLADEDRSRFREARVLIRNEFHGLDGHQQYMNAFSRLLKWDPLRRVTMLGTDQRDLFIPVLKRGVASTLSGAGSVLDIGCGDGQTFALLAESIPAGSVVSGIEPNADFLKSYGARLADRPSLETGTLLCAPFKPELLTDSRSAHDLIFATHVLYFFEDLAVSLLAIYEALAPGGAAFVVFADELTAYTGKSFRSFLRTISETDRAAAHESICRNRLALFAADQTGAGSLSSLIGRTLGDTTVRVEVQRQESRLYGHSLSDVIALCNITGLEDFPSTDKFDAAADLIEHDPEAVDFRIENDPASVRYGMFSVLQPQIVAVVRKTGQ